MGFRTLDIASNTEIHIRNGQLILSTVDGDVSVPIEDIHHIFAHGSNIRLSTMDLSILAQNKVGMTTLDERYLPTAIVIPFEGHARQSKLMHAQVETGKDTYRDLWKQIINKKVSNQARALSILGLEGADIVFAHINALDEDNIDSIEALAAKDYFSYYHEGLNRRVDDPINSRLNYGYAVVRSTIARSLVAEGFHPTFGIHHDSQLNPFNLADDLIEPYRPMVDLVAHNVIGANLFLNKSERRAMTQVLYNACMMDNSTINILKSVELMCDSLKRIILTDSTEQLALPTILPLEKMEGVEE